MRLISIDNIKENMQIGRSIFTMDGKVLLSEGMRLSKRYISRLRELGITSIYIIDEMVGKLEVEEMVKEQTKAEAGRVIKAAMTNISQNKEIDGQKVRQVVNEVMEELLQTREILVNLTDIRSLNDYTFGHNVAVAIYSIMTGLGMGYDYYKLKILGVGAILHDVGKARIPDYIINKPGQLTPGEFKEVQKHCLLGFDILRNIVEVNILSAHIAWQHHEKCDGTGYPRGLKGTEIHELARVVAVADVYDAMSTDRVYRSKYLPSEVIEFIRTSKGTHFDPEIADIFLEYIAPFPVGSRVVLSNGEVATVIKVSKALPDRPVVMVTVDSGGNPLAKGIEKDLKEDLTLFIERPIKD